jgi:DNA-binding beta-propeller fold protein YncE
MTRAQRASGLAVRFRTSSHPASPCPREPGQRAAPAILARARDIPVAGLMVVAAIAFALPAFAGEQQDCGNPKVTMFASGLTNPRHIRFGPGGHLYVVEAGTGGDMLPANTPECPAVDSYSTTPPLHGYMAGFTGRVSRLHIDGARETIIDGLPSARDGLENAYGPTDIAWIGHDMYVLIQAGGCSRGLPNHPAGIIRVRHDGTYHYVADISAFFRRNPAAVEPTCGPNGDCEPDGRPHTMIAYLGKLYVVETNHNSVLKVDPRTGDVSRIHDLSAHNPAPVTVARKGQDFLLGGFNGLIQTFRAPFGKVQELHEGFGGIVDLAIIRERLHVLETSSPHVPGTPPSFAPTDGRLVRIEKDGTQTVIAEGLNQAVGMAKSPSGRAAFVTTFGYGQGAVDGYPKEGLGQVVRISLDDERNWYEARQAAEEEAD